VKRQHIVSLILILLFITGCKGDASPPAVISPSPTEGIVFEKKTIKIRDKTLMVEIADTPEKRQIGLMYRKNLGENEGMLFIFFEEDFHSFWMKNTLIPLSIAFIKEDGTIVQIEDMEPETETTHPSKFPAKYALEVNKGWFKENNITAGDKILLTAN
jgi:uncharacterized membrane protein (UPF0127 family)